MEISQNSTEFDACRLLNNQNCFYYFIDKSYFDYCKVFYYFRDESITQEWTNQQYDTSPTVIQEYANVFGYTADGTLLSNTYLVD